MFDASGRQIHLFYKNILIKTKRRIQAKYFRSLKITAKSIIEAMQNSAHAERLGSNTLTRQPSPNFSKSNHSVLLP